MNKKIKLEELEEFALVNRVESLELWEDHTGEEEEIPDFLEDMLAIAESPEILDEQIGKITSDSERLNEMYRGALRYLLGIKLHIEIDPRNWYSLKHIDISDLWEVFKTGKTIERGINLVYQAIGIKYPNMSLEQSDSDYSEDLVHGLEGSRIAQGASLLRSARPSCKTYRNFRNPRTDL